MIANAFFQMSKESPEISQWLLDVMPGCASIEIPGASGGEVRIIARKDDHVSYGILSGQQILNRLERTADSPLAVAVAWLLLCFHDVYYDTDAFLHDYVKNVCGIRFERVPFFLMDGNLVARCDHSACKGKPKKSDKVIFRVDKNTASVLLPLSSPELRDLLFGRLRRIDT